MYVCVFVLRRWLMRGMGGGGVRSITGQGYKRHRRALDTTGAPDSRLAWRRRARRSSSESLERRLRERPAAAAASSASIAAAVAASAFFGVSPTAGARDRAAGGPPPLPPLPLPTEPPSLSSDSIIYCSD